MTTPPPSPDIGPLSFFAARQPAKLALIDPHRQVTYGEFNERACRLANALRGLGVAGGDKVATLLHNGLAFMETQAAVAKLRATLVPLNYRLKGGEIDYILRDSEATAFVVGAEFLATVRPLYAALPAPLRARIVVVDDPEAVEAAELAGGELAFEGLIAAGAVAEPAAVGEAVGGSMVYTSGTTGRPKGVYRAPVPRDQRNRLRIFATFRIGNDERHLVCCPLYHAAPIMLASTTLLFGGTLVIMPRFDAEDFLRLVERHRITSSAVVPTVLNRIVSLPEAVRRRYDTSSLRALISAGALFPYPLKRRVVACFGDDCLFEYYGSTEAGMSTILQPADQLRKPGSCGTVAPGVEIRLLDANGEPVPAGEAGEMYVRGDNMLDTYYNNETATRRSFRDGFMTVGDVARCDADGFYYIVDRRIDMVISGGVNIYPAEVEAALLTHPRVSDAAVIGVPDPDWGESLRAYVVLQAETPPAERAGIEAALIAHCRATIADYKAPRAVVILDELPYSPSGKVLKRDLRERAERELATQPPSPSGSGPG